LLKVYFAEADSGREETMADQPEAGPIISREIQRFAIKVCIAAVVSVIAVDWIVQSAIDDVEESTARTLQSIRSTLNQTVIGGAPFWAKVEKALDDAATEELPPEKKQRLLRDLGQIVTRYRPFVDEVQTKLKESPAGN
jgi:hypothetical protein